MARRTNKALLHFSQVFYLRDDDLKQAIVNSYGMDSLLNQHKNVIGQQVHTILQKFFQQNVEDQRVSLKKDATAILQSFVDVIEKCNADRNMINVTLPYLDGILQDDRKNIRLLLRIFQNQPTNQNILSCLNNILVTTGHQSYVYEAACKVLSCLYGDLDKREKGVIEKQKDFIRILINLRQKSESQEIYIREFILVCCTANLIKHTNLVSVFLNNGGAQILRDCLVKYSQDLQATYYTLFNLWLISFDKESLKDFANPAMGLIRLTIEVIQKLSREKLVRVAFMCFKNLCDLSQECIEVMVDNNLLKLVDTLMKGNIKDQEVIDDIQNIGEILEKNIKILTSFEKYIKELHAQYFTWSPVHSEKFWKENVKRFEDDDFHLVKLIVNLLNNDRTLNIAIAAYDLGEFCRFHPFGKQILEGQGAKQQIMKHAKHDDPQIREQCLLALQKIMLNNWQSIGK